MINVLNIFIFKKYCNSSNKGTNCTHGDNKTLDQDLPKRIRSLVRVFQYKGDPLKLSIIDLNSNPPILNTLSLDRNFPCIIILRHERKT